MAQISRLEFLRLCEQADDLDLEVQRAIDRGAPPVELKQLRARLVELRDKLIALPPAP